MPLPLIRDPITLSLVRPPIIRNPPRERAPQRSTVYAHGNGQPAPVRVQPGPGQFFMLGLTNADDAPQILAYLHKLSVMFSQSNFVRQFTVELMASGGWVGNNAQDRQIEALLNFVRRNLTYARDPIDSEYVISPVYLLEKISTGQQAFADCEDHVLLLNSMLGAIGFPTRFVAVRINGEDYWNHVISSVFASGKWWDLDPSAKGIMQPEYYVRMEGQTNFAQ